MSVWIPLVQHQSPRGILPWRGHATIWSVRAISLFSVLSQCISVSCGRHNEKISLLDDPEDWEQSTGWVSVQVGSHEDKGDIRKWNPDRRHLVQANTADSLGQACSMDKRYPHQICTADGRPMNTDLFSVHSPCTAFTAISP